MWLAYLGLFGLTYICFSLTLIASKNARKQGFSLIDIFDGYPVSNLDYTFNNYSEIDDHIEIENKKLYKNNPKAYFEIIKEEFYDFHYIHRINLLQYFCDNRNFERLKKILDTKNGILEKINKTILENDLLCGEYSEALDFYGSGLFEMETDIKVPYELLGETFLTSLQQLNYFRWLIDNDYFLHIE